MSRLADFLRSHKDRILEEWLRSASRLPSAHGADRTTIRDHMPELLDRLADAIERDDTTALPMKGLPNLHAALRVREGYDLRQVIAEYRILRGVIHELYSASAEIPEAVTARMKPLRVMHAALDAAIGDAVDQYALDRDRSREMFISMLGHDLRDPLNTVLFGAKALLEKHGEDLPEGAVKTTVRIQTSASRMERMIRDLLDFAHGRLGGGLPVVPAPLDDARVLIRDTVQELAHANPDREVICLAEQAPGNFSVSWDGDRIAQAIANLVSNAISHGHDPVVVEPVDNGQELTIEVRNRGGIPAAVLPTLFDPFTHDGGERRHQDDSTARPERRRGHLGLGLYIVRAIAEAHGGSVSAASEDGHAVFRITLPRHAVVEGDVPVGSRR